MSPPCANLTGMWLWWWKWIVFAVWLTNERCLALFSDRTIVRYSHHRNLRHAASRIWTFPEPEFKISRTKLWSSDNHYTKAPYNPHTTVTLILRCRNLYLSYKVRVYIKIYKHVARLIFFLKINFLTTNKHRGIFVRGKLSTQNKRTHSIVKLLFYKRHFSKRLLWSYFLVSLFFLWKNIYMRFRVSFNLKS